MIHNNLIQYNVVYTAKRCLTLKYLIDRGFDQYNRQLRFLSSNMESFLNKKKDTPFNDLIKREYKSLEVGEIYDLSISINRCNITKSEFRDILENLVLLTNINSINDLRDLDIVKLYNTFDDETNICL